MRDVAILLVAALFGAMGLGALVRPASILAVVGVAVETVAGRVYLAFEIACGALLLAAVWA